MTTENAKDLALEAATNNRYLAALERRLSRPVVIGVAANEKWVEHTPRTGLTFAMLGPLVARIGLDVQDADLGTAFYIGARWLSDFEHPVVSWAAPVARIFYEPGARTHELSDHVLVRRTLLERHNQIVKVYDDWEREASGRSPFEAKALEVPTAPHSSQRRRRLEMRLPESVPELSADGRPTSEPQAHTSADAQPRQENTAAGLREGMRSAEAVDYALNAPRSDALVSVLSTLQPDQYGLVTHRADEPLMIQGHPGTGKTIVAVHRAAYLVSPERPASERVRSLLFLGPTEEWVRHVSDIVKTLDLDHRVSIKAMPSWLLEIAAFRHPVSGPADGSVQDVGKFIKALLDRAAALAAADQPWATGPGARIKNLERIYEVVRKAGTSASALQLGDISREWIPTLPSFGAAIRRRRYLPLFAQASLSILGRAPAQYDHVVVDEAQDLSGLEWEIIRAHNPAGAWTLVGDMNQRRTDFGDSSWARLAERLSLGGPDAPATPHVIERGYRSTQQILDYAKGLLPRAERTTRSLQQHGPVPAVTRANRASDRDPQAVLEAERLIAAYPSGSVALIAVEADAATLEKSLLASGWRRAEQLGDWQKDGSRLALRTPETARGVEFDGVVVVEPGAFPRNLGRIGPLYTSLTRANRELAVVHHGPLPEELRGRGRR